MGDAGHEVDVIVVGAGLSGLAAARRLAGSGARLAVLEARDRVGGRTLTVTHEGAAIDLGAQWVGPTQDRVLALCRELGVRTYPQHLAGRKVLALGGRTRTYRGTIPRISLVGLVSLGLALRKIDRLTGRVDLERPWATPKAAELDGETLETWKRRHLPTRDARAVVDIAARSIFAAEPSELSFLYFITYLASGGGLMRLAEVDGGAQQDRLAGGAQQLSLRLAEPLGPALHLACPARAIRQDDAGVTVDHARGAIRGRYAVLAVPPGLSAAIAFEPPLPPARAQLVQRTPMGSAIKHIFTYPRAFWRERGLSGEAVCDTGPVRLAFDVTSEDGRVPALVAFMLGESARTYGGKPEAERRAEVLAALARFFGPEAAHPSSWHEKSWVADPWSGGCYAGLMSPGVMTSVGHALREPIGRVHHAGTETAVRWAGYLDGAIEAGERAADEVLARLRADGALVTGTAPGSPAGPAGSR